MPRHAVMLAAVLAWFVNIERAEAKLDILVDKSTQRMLVIQDGFVRYMWPVSTGRDNMATPNGTYSPQRLERNWFSTAYYNSPMPFSIFFHNGYAIHGSYAIDRLGGPASHGCVRLHPHHAAILFDLVQREGPGSTTIDVTDQGRPQERPLSGRDIVEGAARDPALVPPRDIAAGPADIPPVPKVVRYREGGDAPVALPAPRPNRSIVARNNLPPPLVAPPPTQPSRRILADVKPPASSPRPRSEAPAANAANGYSRSPNEPSDARSKIAVVEGSKVVDGPKVQAVSPGPAEPAQSASSFKLLPASCWSGGASRWKWWSSGQENSCR
jgi:L,D-transpeptidase catalytic domain